MREYAGEIGKLARKQTKSELLKAQQREQQRTRDRKQNFMSGTAPSTPIVPKAGNGDDRLGEALSGGQ